MAKQFVPIESELPQQSVVSSGTAAVARTAPAAETAAEVAQRQAPKLSIEDAMRGVETRQSSETRSGVRSFGVHLSTAHVETKGDPRKYRLKTATRTSFSGSMTTLPPGKIVSDANYGPGTIKRLRDGGAELEEIT